MEKNIISEKVEDITAVTVSASVLSNLLSVTDRRIRDLAQEGILVRISKGRYDLTQSIKNYILHLKMNNEMKEVNDNDLDLKLEQAKHERIKTEMAEMKLRVMKGKLHDSEDVEKVMTDMLTNFKGKILNMPSKLSPMLVARANLSEVKAILEKECMATLVELSKYDPMLFYRSEYIDLDEEDGVLVEENQHKDT